MLSRKNGNLRKTVECTATGTSSGVVRALKTIISFYSAQGCATITVVVSGTEKMMVLDEREQKMLGVYTMTTANVAIMESCEYLTKRKCNE